MDEGLTQLFLKEKPARALLAVRELDPAYATLVAKRIDSTFPHTIRILNQLEAAGLIRARPEGRVRYLELTAAGHKAADALRALLDLLLEEARPSIRIRTIRKALDGAEDSGTELLIGPLRRDLALLKASSIPSVRREAEELDRQIVAKLPSRKDGDPS